MLATHLSGGKFDGAAIRELSADELRWLLRRRQAAPEDVPAIHVELKRRHRLLLISERRREPMTS